MAAAARRRHGNMPQRRATLLTRGYQSSVAKQVTTTAPERPPIGTSRTTGPDLLGRRQLCGIEMGPGWTFLCKAKMAPSSPEQPTTPTTVCETIPDIQRLVHNRKNNKADGNDKTKAALLKKIRIPPEAQRILGHLCVATVRLERLRIKMNSGQSVSLAMVLPQLTLSCPPHSELLTQDAASAKVMNPEKQVQQTVSSLSMPQSSGSREEESTESEPWALVHELELSPEQPGNKESPAGVESEDFCAVCLNGGDLLCCDGCPKVYHLSCHIPPLVGFPLGDWVCTLCRSDREPEVNYDCESERASTDHHGVVTPYTLSSLDQRRCEKLTLLLSSHILSAPFQEPVSPLARHYYQIIKRPIDLSVIRKKLDHRNTLHYFTAEQFVDDVRLMFRNCATFNYPDSEVAHAGRNLDVFFRSKLREIFPNRTFPTKFHDRADRTSLTWLNRKRRDYHRKKGSHFLDRRHHHF
ncbi:hypothetical protein UPYG_G00260530 [Umbra pygmaea]|uniref:Uncharacterized protein n=1 Tax=Umbra pygmaea TaxID=75934 RepID=A0ABD0WDJ7_UMBPY